MPLCWLFLVLIALLIPYLLIGVMGGGITLSQITAAHEEFEGFGETGEFTLARREGDQIVWLLGHRHQGGREPQRIRPFRQQFTDRQIAGIQLGLHAADGGDCDQVADHLLKGGECICHDLDDGKAGRGAQVLRCRPAPGMMQLPRSPLL